MEISTAQLKDSRQGLIDCGAPAALADEAARIRSVGSPQNDADRQIIREVSQQLRGADA